MLFILCLLRLLPPIVLAVFLSSFPPFFVKVLLPLLICIIVCSSFTALACIKASSHHPSVMAVSSEIKWLCKSSRPCLVILIWYTGWNRVIIGEVIIKGLSSGPPPRCLSACSLKDIGRRTGPISPFASRPHRKSRWVMAPGSAISGVRQIGGGLITTLRRCVMKLSAPSELSTSISSSTPSLLAFLCHCSVNSAFTLSAAVFGHQSSLCLTLTRSLINLLTFSQEGECCLLIGLSVLAPFTEGKLGKCWYYGF